jgi:hypothetical protein
VTEAHVAAVETVLGHRLPAAYRRFLLGYTDELNRELLSPFWTFSGDIICHNLAYWRNPGGYMVRVQDGAGGWLLYDEPWPAHFLVIGDNEGSDNWFVHLGRTGKGIWTWSHESLEAKFAYPTFPAAVAYFRKRRARERGGRPFE